MQVTEALTLLRIRLEGVDSKNEMGARKTDVIIPWNKRCAVSMAILDSNTALPNMKMELPPDNSTNIAINCLLLTLLSFSVAHAIQ